MATISIVDDHDLFRSGLEVLIKTIGDHETFEFPNGKFFLESLDAVKPDLILMDINMPVMNGIETTREAMKKFPDLKILVLSMYDDPDYYNQFIELGVKGFMLKDNNIESTPTTLFFLSA